MSVIPPDAGSDADVQRAREELGWTNLNKEKEMDLEQFVSDYWQMYKDNGGEKPTANEIAESYMETANLEGPVTDNLINQIKYYLPA